MKKFLLIIFLLIVLIGLGIGSYRAYNQLKNLPVKSMTTIQDALNHGDKENFYKLVDVEKVLDDAAREILTLKINSEINSTSYSMQEIENLYNQRKPEFIEVSKAALEDYLNFKQVKFPQNLSPTQKWFKDSEINSCVIKSIYKPKIKDNSATSRVEFYNQSLLFGFELDFSLEKIDDKTWKIIGVKGFDTYLVGLNRALKKKLERLNAPVRNEMKDIFVVKGFTAKVVEGDEYGFSKTLQLAIKADVKSEKNLSKIIGQIIIVGKDGDEGITPFEIDMAYKPKGLQTFNVNKVLNPFVRQDADAMKHGLKKSAVHIEVTEVIFMDGTSLKQFDELPE